MNSARWFERWVTSPEWLRAFLIAGAACVAAYVLNSIIGEINPSNWWGITYGTLATVLMIGVALYAVRRRKLKNDYGKSKVWLQFHLYAGALFMILVFMHTGFRLPSGALNWWLWGLSLWVTVSGLIGVALQKWIPRILTSGLATEAVYERIPELVAQIRERAGEMVSTCTQPLQEFYERTVAPALTIQQTRMIYYFDVTGGIQQQVKQFDYVRRILSPQEQETLDRLEAMFRTKLELDAHFTLQKALRWWLYTHVPLSLVLLVLVVIHLYAVWYY